MNLSFIWTIISFVIVFSLMVICHEGGHFIVARMNGVKVYEFMIGLGPAFIKFEKWGTKFTVRALPFGGACLFANPDEVEEDEIKKDEEEKLAEDLDNGKDKLFNDVSVFKRIAICFAGPLCNVILGYILSIIVVFFCGSTGTTIYSVKDNSPAEIAGLRAGDQIIKINNERIYLFNEIRLISFTDKNESWTVTYLRDGNKYETVIYPRDNEELVREIGVTTKDFIDCSNMKMFKYAAYETRFSLKATFKSLRMLVTGNLSKDDVSGPVGNIAYITDFNQIDDCEFEKLKGLDHVTINCVKRTPHYSHFSLDEALAFFDRVGAKHSWLTHISHLLPGYAELDAELKAYNPTYGVAYDGLVIE